MQVDFQPFTIHKRFPLTISRGTTAENTNIWVRIQAEEIEGWGEASPFSIVQEGKKDTDKVIQELAQITPHLAKYHPLERQQIEELLLHNNISSVTRAAIDMALYDWLGKRADLPLWRLLGLDKSAIVPISVTVGINTPEGAKKRVRDWMELMDVKLIKIKLGSPKGIAADKEMLLAIKEEASNIPLMVDANGGWSLDNALKMSEWLAQQGVIYIEQPLAVGQEKDLFLLYQRLPLPIFVDESCFSSLDIPRLASCVHGINIKMMKAGGISEVLRMIHIAKGCGLQVMFGCYSDSSLSNTAMSVLSPLVDYLDLDSHLNLIDDPFIGAKLEEGKLLPNDLPGLGVTQKIS
ncbi:dipeptide epimerase [Aphanothece hegewaldii CCALA 016]|uniref:Dipeptide epimerase n=1 Tax=Aphanothece hegewaldii CCALA 016 TaxID=2107694 RepID=A0A2T1M3M1_9CHRO|nr:dipeptide epimerase [Aphanothece hegewaldii]PSF39437.1 dipeptide epimerase [Aphanothece hegewaldii CCALA 016]